MKRFVGWVAGLTLLLGAAWSVLNYQLIVDYAVATQYKPSSAMLELERQVAFTERGTFLFHATQAELNDASSFSNHCDKKDQQSVVLGCYIGPQQIYIFDVQDERLAGIRQVTAAHEMLHAAYDRLPLNERQKVDTMIETALPSVLQSKSELAERLQLYEKTEPGERNNELHSILGSEAETLPAELENYYKQYFKDRRIITNYAASYSKVFNDLKANQDALVAQLQALNDEITTLTNQYNAEAETLSRDIDTFNARASRSNGFNSQAEFNAARADLSARVNNLETQRQVINDKISLHEQKRTELLALNVQVEELNSKLDSTALPSL